MSYHSAVGANVRFGIGTASARTGLTNKRSMAVEKTDLEKLAREIAMTVYNCHGAVLIGDPPPVTRETYVRMNDVQAGDLVVEWTTCLMKNRPALHAVGHLLRVAHEPVRFSDPDFVWNDKEEGRPHPKETIYYIRTLDGREFRWENASFISAPTEWPMRGSSTT